MFGDTLAAISLGAVLLGAGGCGGAGAAAASNGVSAGEEAEGSSAPPRFDAEAAYDEFESALRASYAYLERADFDVDAHLAHTRELATAAGDRRSLRRVLHRAMLAFTDPHLLVTPLEDTDPNVWPTSSDLAVRLAGESFLVEDVRAGSPADAAGVRPGFSVVSVHGVSIADRVSELLRAVESPTARQRAYAATLAVNGRRAGARKLTFETPDGAVTYDLPNPRAFAEEVASRPPLELSVQGGVGVIRLHNSLGRMETIEAFDEAIGRCLELEGVIIDLRNTPSGGNTDVARGLIGHFITEPRPYQVHEVPAIERRTSVPRRFVEYVLPRAPHFGGRVAVLGGRWTGSMGEGTVIGLHAAAGARTFASNMGDLLGALHSLELPASGATLELGAEALFHVDGTPRADFVADVPLKTADRDPDGRDPAMTAARAWLSAPPRSE